MPKAIHHQSQRTTKLLNIGKPGSGKTGALACLAKAGYRLIIVDFDNGLDILIELLRDDPKALDRVYFETFTDRLHFVKGVARVDKSTSRSAQMLVTKGAPTAWVNAMAGLTRWKFPVEPGSKETYDLGNIGEWGPDTVVVIDSLGLGGQAAFRFIKQLQGHQFDEFSDIGDFGKAMDRLEGMLQLLYSDGVKCHVIVNTHVVFIENATKDGIVGLPRALGSKLPPFVGGYFNSAVHTEMRGTKRIINTQPQGVIDVKIPLLPDKISARLPIETGLLTIFKTLQSRLEEKKL